MSEHDTPKKLFAVQHQFAYMHRDEPRCAGDICGSSIEWSGQYISYDPLADKETRIVSAETADQAWSRMQEYILEHPADFTIWGQTVSNLTPEKRRNHFERAFGREVDEGNPELGDHRLVVTEITNFIG